MTTTVRMLATYDGSPPQTIRALPDTLAAFFIAQGNATLDLTGGIAYVPVVAPDTYETAKVQKNAAGAVQGLTDANGVQVSAGGGGSFTLPVATGAVLGGVKASATVAISGAGVASVPVATTNALGAVAVDGTSIVIDGAGKISSATPADPVGTQTFNFNVDGTVNYSQIVNAQGTYRQTCTYVGDVVTISAWVKQ